MYLPTKLLATAVLAQLANSQALYFYSGESSGYSAGSDYMVASPCFVRFFDIYGCSAYYPKPIGFVVDEEDTCVAGPPELESLLGPTGDVHLSCGGEAGYNWITTSQLEIDFRHPRLPNRDIGIATLSSVPLSTTLPVSLPSISSYTFSTPLTVTGPAPTSNLG